MHSPHVVKNLQIKNQFVPRLATQFDPDQIVPAGLGWPADDPPVKPYGKGHKIHHALAQDTGRMKSAVQRKR